MLETSPATFSDTFLADIVYHSYQ